MIINFCFYVKKGQIKTPSNGRGTKNWGQKDSELITYVMENEEVFSVCLDDLDRDYEVAPTTIGLDYNEICNKRFHLTR